MAFREQIAVRNAEYLLLQLRGVCLSGEYRSSNSARRLQLAGRYSWARCSMAGYWVSGTGVVERVISAISSGRDVPVEIATRDGSCPARFCDAHSP
jgi:hypothetical protein